MGISGGELGNLVMGDEGDGILNFLIRVLEFRALILSLKEGHLFGRSAVVRVLSWWSLQIMVLTFWSLYSKSWLQVSGSQCSGIQQLGMEFQGPRFRGLPGSGMGEN